MNYELISDVEYATLPGDPEQCFVEIEAICRRNMTRIISNSNNDNSEIDRALYTVYMSIVAAAASECGIQGVNYEGAVNTWDEFGTFSLAVQGAVAKILIRGRGNKHPYSVQLTARAKGAIEIQIGKLRRAIVDSDLDNGRKKSLDRKLDELLAELKSETRLSFARTMATLALITAATAGLTTIAADGPQAIQNILKVIGVEKQTEEEAVQRLAPPPKLLTTSVRAKAVEARKPQFSSDLDDDIPF